MRVKKLSKIICLPVACQGILCQVIGPDREKINLFCQFLRNQNGSRRLDHNTDLRIFLVRNALGIQFCHHFLTCSFAFLHFPHRCDHRKHDRYFPISGSAVQSPELGAEYFGTVQADADRTYTQGRIFFLL